MSNSEHTSIKAMLKNCADLRDANKVDVRLLYRQKWALLRIAGNASDKDNGTEYTDDDLIEGLIIYLDSETDRLDPDDSIRQSMPETE